MGIFKRSGQSLIEMVCAILIIVPVFFCLIDLYFLVMGYWYSASDCRQAARAASQGPPSAVVAGEPENRALRVLNTDIAENNPTIHLDQYTVTESITSLPDPTVGGAVIGTVTVAITVSITPPFILKYVLSDNKFINNISETCPYTWVQQGHAQ